MWHCHLSSYEYGILAGTVPGRNNKKTPYMYWPPKGNWSKGKGKKYIYIPGNFQASELFMDNDSKSVDKHWVLSHTHTHTHTHTTKGQYFLLYYALGDCAVPGQWGKSTVVGGGGGVTYSHRNTSGLFPFCGIGHRNIVVLSCLFNENEIQIIFTTNKMNVSRITSENRLTWTKPLFNLCHCQSITMHVRSHRIGPVSTMTQSTALQAWPFN